MMMDIDQAAKAMRDEEILAEIEDFIEGFNQPTYRGMRINGQRVATSSSQRSGCGHAWTPRRDFAVWKSVTQSLTVGSVAFQKAGAHRVTLRADPVRAHHGPTGGPARVASGREPRSPLGAGAASIGQFIY